MSDKITKSPQIRFAGFTDAWEQRKVGEFLTESKIKGSDGSIAKKLTVKLWRKGIVPKEEIYQGSSATQYYVRKSGQFMYGKLDFLNQAFGIVPSELDGYESTLDSPAFDFRDGINSRFFLEYISLKRFYKYQGNIANGSRKAKRIHAETFFEMPIPVPSYDEQQTIGLFFEQLDTTITLHQRKLELLKDTKKSLLQKMFPKDGANVPEIRFAGFTDAWEQRRLGDFIEDFIEKTTIQNQYPVLTSSQQMGIVLQEDYFANRQVTTDENIGYFVLPKGYFTYRSRSDNHVFVFNRNDLIDKGIISYFYPVFRVKNADSNFFLRRLNFGIERQISIAAEGTGQHVLSLKKFKDIEAMFPSVQEQEKIGSFYANLDQLITLHQRELNSLKNLKKSLLQQMYV